LSCGGTLTVRFRDNALVDVAGPDLYVFEVGPAVEATDLAISADGKNWIEVGKIAGGRADVDIASYVKAGDVFHYVRLTDLKSGCSGRWPGADIDAVGAIGAAVQFSLSGSVLFDTGLWELKPEAAAAIDELADKLAAYSKGRVLVEGHTDNVGSGEANQTLSKNRAGAVLEYLRARPALSAFSFTAEGHGESRPTATNETDEGRAQNRRVDVVLIPGGE
jgi:outer membrane protein OmpA-like peptidoglycan-associated protein